MIVANKNESFPITVTLIDEATGSLASGEEVHYFIRTVDDLELSPPVSGIMTESSFSPGIYKTGISITSPGIYICHAKCSGFLAGTEEIIINEENIYEVVKNTHQHNISVEDVKRDTVIPTESQALRNVPFGATDYIINRIKAEADSDWSNPVISGNTWAWYNAVTGGHQNVNSNDILPYKMGSEF